MASRAIGQCFIFAAFSALLCPEVQALRKQVVEHSVTAKCQRSCSNIPLDVFLQGEVKTQDFLDSKCSWKSCEGCEGKKNGYQMPCCNEEGCEDEPEPTPAPTEAPITASPTPSPTPPPGCPDQPSWDTKGFKCVGPDHGKIDKSCCDPLAPCEKSLMVELPMLEQRLTAFMGCGVDKNDLEVGENGEYRLTDTGAVCSETCQAMPALSKEHEPWDLDHGSCVKYVALARLTRPYKMMSTVVRALDNAFKQCTVPDETHETITKPEPEVISEPEPTLAPLTPEPRDIVPTQSPGPTWADRVKQTEAPEPTPAPESTPASTTTKCFAYKDNEKSACQNDPECQWVKLDKCHPTHGCQRRKYCWEKDSEPEPEPEAPNQCYAYKKNEATACKDNPQCEWVDLWKKLYKCHPVYGCLQRTLCWDVSDNSDDICYEYTKNEASACKADPHCEWVNLWRDHEKCHPTYGCNQRTLCWRSGDVPDSFSQ